MGAKGTWSKEQILFSYAKGVANFMAVGHTVIPDRIEAGTYLALAGAIGTDLLSKNVYCRTF